MSKSCVMLGSGNGLPPYCEQAITLSVSSEDAYALPCASAYLPQKCINASGMVQIQITCFQIEHARNWLAGEPDFPACGVRTVACESFPAQYISLSALVRVPHLSSKQSVSCGNIYSFPCDSTYSQNAYLYLYACMYVSYCVKIYVCFHWGDHVRDQVYSWLHITIATFSLKR